MKKIAFSALIVSLFLMGANQAQAFSYFVSSSLTDHYLSPNSDGVKETVSIDQEFTETLDATIQIVDAGGAVVKNLYHSGSVKNPLAKIWDGKDDASVIVPDGVYYVRYTLVGSTGTETTPLGDEYKITVDTISPAVSPVEITPFALVSPNSYVGKKATISIVVADSGSGINPVSCAYNIDGGATGADTVPTAYDPSAGKCIFSDLDTSAAVGIAATVEDNAGNRFNTSSSWVNVLVDVTKPVTTATAETSVGAYPFGEVSDKDVSVNLTATDAESGVKKIMYSINGASYADYSAPLVFSTDGDFTLNYYGLDNVDNQEDAGAVLIKITKPVNIVHGGGSSAIPNFDLKNFNLGLVDATTTATTSGKVLGASTERIKKAIDTNNYQIARLEGHLSAIKHRFNLLVKNLDKTTNKITITKVEVVPQIEIVTKNASSTATSTKN